MSHPDLITRIGYLSPACVVFDFGGTLIDFTPLHINGFLSCLENGDRSRISSLLTDAVHAGMDSYAMAEHLAGGLGRRLDVDDLVLRKRVWVEHELQALVLPPDSCRLVEATMKICPTAVITQGMGLSVQQVLQRSLGADALHIRVLGRTSVEEHVDKEAMLRRVRSDLIDGVGMTVFVGDSAKDERIAAATGALFVRHSPFASIPVGGDLSQRTSVIH